ncbi:accessory gene regulator B family protein [Clostridiaceae bacterium M8S5]|nr:accessory gene regulator B family protein [Clostridiaceae bacterium M8S5]
MDKFAHMLTKKIKKQNPTLTEIEALKIQFGFECLLNEISKTMLFLFIFYFFGWMSNLVIILMFYGGLRLFAGGLHADTYWRCFALSLVTYIVITLLGLYTIPNNVTKIVMIIVCIVLLFLYSPADHPNKPIISNKRKRNMKYMSIIALIVFFVISLFLPASISATALYALLFECISVPLSKLRIHLSNKSLAK